MGVGANGVSSAEFTPIILYGGKRRFSNKKPLQTLAGVTDSPLTLPVR